VLNSQTLSLIRITGTITTQQGFQEILEFQKWLVRSVMPIRGQQT